jgi:putative transcriptional regulator
LGYAGWGPGQLEQEMARHGWFATPGEEALLYGCDVNARWSAAFKAAGIDTRLLTSAFGTA